MSDSNRSNTGQRRCSLPAAIILPFLRCNQLLPWQGWRELPRIWLQVAETARQKAGAARPSLIYVIWADWESSKCPFVEACWPSKVWLWTKPSTRSTGELKIHDLGSSSLFWGRLQSFPYTRMRSRMSDEQSCWDLSPGYCSQYLHQNRNRLDDSKEWVTYK